MTEIHDNALGVVYHTDVFKVCYGVLRQDGTGSWSWHEYQNECVGEEAFATEGEAQRAFLRHLKRKGVRKGDYVVVYTCHLDKSTVGRTGRMP